MWKIEGVPLKSLDIRVEVDDLAMRTVIRQKFRNELFKRIEAVYTFPIGWANCVSRFAAIVGGERLVARAMPKAEAAKTYENALEKGKRPMLIETNHEGIATVTLGNMAKGEEIELEITLDTVLVPENSVVRINVPTVIGQRYEGENGRGGLMPYEAIEHNALIEYPCTVSFDIKGMLASCPVSCPSHHVKVSGGEDTLHIDLMKVYADRNIVLVFEQVPARQFAVWAKDEIGGGYGGYCVFCTEPTGANRDLDLQILVDCSGSMNGLGMTKTKEALAGLKSVLREGDRITFSRFGNSVVNDIGSFTDYSAGMWRRSMIPLIDMMDADLGGTELENGIRAVLSPRRLAKAARKDAERALLLITDGECWQAEEIANYVAKKNVPVFIIGVGLSSPYAELRKIADASGGMCECVCYAEDVLPVAERLVRAMRTPHVSSSIVFADCDGLWLGNTSKVTKSGSAVLVHWHSAVMPKAVPLLETESAGVCRTYVGEWQRAANEEAVIKMVANRSYVTDRDAEIDIAQAYGFLGMYTSLILVAEASADKSDSELLKTLNVPQMASFEADTDLCRGPSPFNCGGACSVDLGCDCRGYDFGFSDQDRDTAAHLAGRIMLAVILVAISKDDILKKIDSFEAVVEEHTGCCVDTDRWMELVTQVRGGVCKEDELENFLSIYPEKVRKVLEIVQDQIQALFGLWTTVDCDRTTLQV